MGDIRSYRNLRGAMALQGPAIGYLFDDFVVGCVLLHMPPTTGTIAEDIPIECVQTFDEKSSSATDPHRSGGGLNPSKPEEDITAFGTTP